METALETLASVANKQYLDMMGVEIAFRSNPKSIESPQPSHKDLVCPGAPKKVRSNKRFRPENADEVIRHVRIPPAEERECPGAPLRIRLRPLTDTESRLLNGVFKN